MAVPEPRLADVEYLEVQCKSALNPVKGMGFGWSLNPYTGCEHRCAFCYVRAFERRADRPSDDRYGRTVRVKVNVAAVLRSEVSRKSWRKETVVIGAATDPYQPAEGRFKLTRQCLEVLRDFSNPAAMITRGPMIVRDLDVLTELARRAQLHITFSIPTVDDDIWRRTEPGTAHPKQRLRAIEKLVGAGIDVGVGMAPILPGLSDRPDRLEAVVKAARASAATRTTVPSELAALGFRTCGVPSTCCREESAVSRRPRSPGGPCPATSTSSKRTANSSRCACSSTRASSIGSLTRDSRASRASQSRRVICAARWSTSAYVSSSLDCAAMSTEQKKPAESLVQGLLAEKRELKVQLERVRMELAETREGSSGPDPRLKDLEVEVERLRHQLATARADANVLREERDELRAGIEKALEQIADLSVEA